MDAAADLLVNKPRKVRRVYADDTVLALSKTRSWHIKSRHRALYYFRLLRFSPIFQAWINKTDLPLFPDHLFDPKEWYYRVHVGWHSIELLRTVGPQLDKVKAAKANYLVNVAVDVNH